MIYLFKDTSILKMNRTRLVVYNDVGRRIMILLATLYLEANILNIAVNVMRPIVQHQRCGKH